MQICLRRRVCAAVVRCILLESEDLRCTCRVSMSIFNYVACAAIFVLMVRSSARTGRQRTVLKDIDGGRLVFRVNCVSVYIEPRTRLSRNMQYFHTCTCTYDSGIAVSSVFFDISDEFLLDRTDTQIQAKLLKTDWTHPFVLIR